MARKGTGRIIFGMAALVISLLLMILGTSMIYYNWKLYSDVDAETPAAMVVDLSKPARYATDFRSDYQAEHGQQMWLHIEPPFSSRDVTLAAIDGLKLNVYFDDGITTDLVKEVTGSDFQFWDGREAGDYRFAAIPRDEPCVNLHRFRNAHAGTLVLEVK
jgi:hypothetical protein